MFCFLLLFPASTGPLLSSGFNKISFVVAFVPLAAATDDHFAFVIFALVTI